MEKVELPILRGNDKEKYIPITLIVSVVVLILLLILTCLSLTFKKVYKIHYSDNSNIDYKVYLKENSDFPEPYLGKDQLYLSSLIDYVDADFNYSFHTGENVDLKYSYDVTADLIISNSDGKVIKSSTEKLLKPVTINKGVNNNFDISEKIKIDYDKYNTIAKEFVNKYDISGDIKLVVSLNIKVIGEKAEFDKQISDSSVIKLTIPLTYKTIDIAMDYDLSNNKDAVLQYSEAVIKNKTLFRISIGAIIVEVILAASVIIYIITQRDAATLYKIRLNKILKENERYISETVITERVEDMLRTRSLRIEIIKNFEDLMDIRDSIHRPILYHEEKAGEEAVFYIISEQVGYIYVMSIKDFKKRKLK